MQLKTAHDEIENSHEALTSLHRNLVEEHEELQRDLNVCIIGNVADDTSASSSRRSSKDDGKPLRGFSLKARRKAKIQELGEWKGKYEELQAAYEEMHLRLVGVEAERDEVRDEMDEAAEAAKATAAVAAHALSDALGEASAATAAAESVAMEKHASVEESHAAIRQRLRLCAGHVASRSGPPARLRYASSPGLPSHGGVLLPGAVDAAGNAGEFLCNCIVDGSQLGPFHG